MWCACDTHVLSMWYPCDEVTKMVVYQAIMMGLVRLLITKELNARDTEMLTYLIVDRWVEKSCGVHVIPMWGPCDEATNMVVYQATMRGLERLLITKVLNAPDTEMLTKLSVDRWVEKPCGVHVIPMWCACDIHMISVILSVLLQAMYAISSPCFSCTRPSTNQHVYRGTKNSPTIWCYWPITDWSWVTWPREARHGDGESVHLIWQVRCNK